MSSELLSSPKSALKAQDPFAHRPLRRSISRPLIAAVLAVEALTIALVTAELLSDIRAIRSVLGALRKSNFVGLACPERSATSPPLPSPAQQPKLPGVGIRRVRRGVERVRPLSQVHYRAPTPSAANHREPHSPRYNPIVQSLRSSMHYYIPLHRVERRQVAGDGTRVEGGQRVREANEREWSQREWHSKEHTTYIRKQTLSQ